MSPNFRALILCTVWDTLIWNTDDKNRWHRILSAFETHWADPRLPRTIADQLRDTGLKILQPDVYTVLGPEYDANTYCYGIIGFIVSDVTGQNPDMAEDAGAWAARGMRQKDNEDNYFCSINRWIFLVSKPDSKA